MAVTQLYLYSIYIYGWVIEAAAEMPSWIPIKSWTTDTVNQICPTHWHVIYQNDAEQRFTIGCNCALPKTSLPSALICMHKDDTDRKSNFHSTDSKVSPHIQPFATNAEEKGNSNCGSFTRWSYIWAMRRVVVEGYGLILTTWGNACRDLCTRAFSLS